MSVLQTLKDPLCKSPISMYIQELSIRETNSRLSFMWVPGHVGIHGNEHADNVAKLSLEEVFVSPLKIHYKDMYARINRYVNKLWTDSWCETSRNINDTISRMKTADKSGVTAKSEKLIARILLGHSHLTHSFLLHKTEKPECDYCKRFLTIPHVLYDCPLYSAERLLHKISPETVYIKPNNLVKFLVSTSLNELL